MHKNKKNILNLIPEQEADAQVRAEGDGVPICRGNDNTGRIFFST